MAKRALALVASLGLLVAIAVPVSARNIHAQNRYSLHNLQSDVPGAAAATDPDLVNGWGLAAGPVDPPGPATPWWVAANETSKSTLYNGNSGAKLGLVVSVPHHPTGIVFNGSADFVVTGGGGTAAARFIFATQDGTIMGWNGGGAAVQGAITPDASYTGLAIGSSGGANYLYAANFPAGTIDVFDKSFAPAHLAGNFTDPRLRRSYHPFGIQNIGGEIFVAYAKINAAGQDEVKGEGLGFVSAFGTDGTFHGRVASRGELNAPWGLAMAPATGFGKFSGDLLVGNFGDGQIHAFRHDEDGWEEHGVIKGTNHRPIEIDGLWGIAFGNGGGAGPTTTLFFAAGPDEEAHGLFGSITAPTP